MKVTLKVLALPSQTTLLFMVIIGVVLVAIAASSLPNSPLRAAPSLAVILIVLTLRDFLTQPEREMQAHGMAPLPAERFPSLVAAVESVAKSIEYAPAPRLMAASNTPGALFAFGSFRRSYITVGETLARQIERDIASPLPAARIAAESAILHELQHLKQGDVILVGLARSLLKVSTLFMLWSAAFFLGMATVAFAFPASEMLQPSFLIQLEGISPQLAAIVRDLFTPELAEKMRRAPDWGLAALYVLNAHLPILVSAFALFVTIWRRLLRVREIYADTATATAQNRSSGVESAILRYGVVASLASVSDSVKKTNATPASNLLGFHPSGDVRRQAIRNPVAVLADPVSIGITAGVLVLLLDMLLVGSFTLGIVSEAPGAVAILTGFAVISLGLLPLVAADSGDTKRWGKAMGVGVGWVLLIRMGFHFLNLALLWIGAFVAPGDVAAALNGLALGSVGVLQRGAQAIGPADLLALAVEGTAFGFYLTILIAVTLPTVLLLDWQLKRLTLTWYALPNARRGIIRIWWLITSGIILGAAGIWLPIVNSIVPLSAGHGFSSADIILIAASLIALGAGGGWLRRLHKRYARRCRNCGGTIPGWFYIGRQCAACGEVLHEWLQTRY